MKNLFFILFLVATVIKAQDSIVKKTDTLIFTSRIILPVYVKSIEPDQVKYTKKNNPSGPMYTVKKTDLRMIRFANGTRENFDSLRFIASGKEQIYDMRSLKPADKAQYDKGMKDAMVYYKNLGGSIGTGITSLLLGPLGLIPAFCCSLTPPKTENLGYPDKQLWENEYYRIGYRQKAKRIKVSRVWTGFGVGFVSGAMISWMLRPVQ